MLEPIMHAWKEMSMLSRGMMVPYPATHFAHPVTRNIKDEHLMKTRNPPTEVATGSSGLSAH